MLLNAERLGAEELLTERDRPQVCLARTGASFVEWKQTDCRAQLKRSKLFSFVPDIKPDERFAGLYCGERSD
jgi:hypothetical protein